MEDNTIVVALLYSVPSGPCGGAETNKLVRLTPESLDAAVDVGAVARSMGLVPSSVRLNGHLLGVAGGGSGDGRWLSSVTWRSLLAFFYSRSHPTGTAADPIRVQGKLLSQGTESFSLKRKSTAPPTQDPCQAKKRRSGDLEDGGDGGILSLKRKLRLDCETAQKRKRTEGNFLTTVSRPEVGSGLLAGNPNASLCNTSCVADNLHHSRQGACGAS